MYIFHAPAPPRESARVHTLCGIPRACLPISNKPWHGFNSSKFRALGRTCLRGRVDAYPVYNRFYQF